MAISKDIKDLIKSERKKTITTSPLIYKLVIFLALVGLIAIIAGSVYTCEHRKSDSVVEAVHE